MTITIKNDQTYPTHKQICDLMINWYQGIKKIKNGTMIFNTILSLYLMSLQPMYDISTLSS